MSRGRGDDRSRRARRETAMARPELREQGTARSSAAGPMSFPVKQRDRALADQIAQFMNRGREAQLAVDRVLEGLKRDDKPERCPDCGVPVATIFCHVAGCPPEEN